MVTPSKKDTPFTSKDLENLIRQEKFDEVEEYAYHTLSEIDMQLLKIKNNIERALEV